MPEPEQDRPADPGPGEEDDFGAEVEALRNSRRFQSFLDRRMRSGPRTSLEDIEAELKEELARISGG